LVGALIRLPDPTLYTPDCRRQAQDRAGDGDFSPPGQHPPHPGFWLDKEKTMNTVITRSFQQRLALAVSAIVLSVAAAAHAAIVPPIQNRDFEMHLDSVHDS